MSRAGGNSEIVLQSDEPGYMDGMISITNECFVLFFSKPFSLFPIWVRVSDLFFISSCATFSLKHLANFVPQWLRWTFVTFFREKWKQVKVTFLATLNWILAQVTAHKACCLSIYVSRTWKFFTRRLYVFLSILHDNEVFFSPTIQRIRSKKKKVF